MLEESLGEGLKLAKQASEQFEKDTVDGIRKFLDGQVGDYRKLEVEHYEGSDRKYHSDIRILNPATGKEVWIEAKKNKYANLGSVSFKFTDCGWRCTTLDNDDPLTSMFLDALKDNSKDFIAFCRKFLGKYDISLPKELTKELVDAWRASGGVDDTDNDTQFITNKIPLEQFGFKIAEFYKFSKNEQVYYIQVGDNLYIIDPNYNPLNLACRNGEPLKPLSEVYRRGRIQFRMKGQEKASGGTVKHYYSIFCDVKILADKDNMNENYKCSFLQPEKYPVVENGENISAMAEILEAIDRIMSENLTIPENPDDKVEKELRRKLDKNYDHADRIIRWYRADKKAGTDEKELKRMYVSNLDNIKDLLKTYDEYIGKLKKLKMHSKPVEIETDKGRKIQFDPVKDFDKIRRLSGARKLISALGNIAHSDATIDVDDQKYAITDKDRKNIKIVAFTEHVVCWQTQGYETTNKLVYQLWRNPNTIGRGDVYGDPDEQTPYCTHSRNHWDEYAEEYGDDYKQFWYLIRMDNGNVAKMSALNKMSSEKYTNERKNPDIVNREMELKKSAKYIIGDLTNPEVSRTFNLMSYSGPYTIIAMNDSGNDFLDKYDNEFYSFSHLQYGDEVKKIDDLLDDEASKSAEQYVLDEFVDAHGTVFIDDDFISNMDKNGFTGIMCRFPKAVKEIVPASNDSAKIFRRMTKLRVLPPVNLRECTKADRMFQGLENLEETPQFTETENIGSATFMFCDCDNLRTVNDLEFKNCLDLRGMFHNCQSLEAVGRIVAPRATSIREMFYGCGSLWHVDDIVVSPRLTVVGFGSINARVDDHTEELFDRIIEKAKNERYERAKQEGVH